MRDASIYQVVLSDAVVPYLDPGFQPLDWRANPEPGLREIAIHAHVAREGLYRGRGLTGVLSAKFHAKTRLVSGDVRSWIADHPGHDIYLISGHPHSPYFAFDSFERGGMLFGADFDGLIRQVCERLGMPVPDGPGRQSNRNLALASYWVATPDFWRAWYRDVIEPILSEEVLGAELFARVHADRKYQPGAPRVYLAPFIYERLVSLYVARHGVRARFWPWSHQEILGLRLARPAKDCLARIMPVIDAIDEASAWTDGNRGLPAREYAAMRASFSGPLFDVQDSADFNLPAIGCPR